MYVSLVYGNDKSNNCHRDPSTHFQKQLSHSTEPPITHILMLWGERPPIGIANNKFAHPIIFFSHISVFFCNFATAYASKVSSCKKSIATLSRYRNSAKFQ